MKTPLELAADPLTSPEVLYELAAQNPEVRAAIAGNPAAYPGLLEWLGQLGDPEINAALAVRTGSGDPPEIAAAQPEDVPELSAAIANLDEEHSGQELTVELDQVVANVEDGLALEAANPETAPVRLQQLAAEFPGLRGTILTNPACYPELAEWIMLKQPELIETGTYEDLADTTQIEVVTEDLTATVSAATAIPFPTEATGPYPLTAQTGRSPRGLWAAFIILGVLAASSVAVGLVLIFQ